MIIDSFNKDDQELVSLEDFYGEKKYLIDKCIVTFSIHIFNEIKNRFPLEEIARIKAANGDNPIYSCVFNNEKIGVYLSCIGSTLASQDTIEVNHMTGANKFVVFGSCGGLKTNLNRYIIPTEAYRDEGMSYHYKEPSDYILIKNNNIVSSIFDELNIKYSKGRIWTTDAFLRETKEQVSKRVSEGCLGVEMEVAGLQSVADFYGYDIYPFLEVGDIFYDDSYDNEKLRSANNDFHKLDIALEIIKRI